MNFIDYCIETKNYSALSAINDYTKNFALKLKKGTNRDIINADDRLWLADRLRLIRSEYNNLSPDEAYELGSKLNMKPSELRDSAIHNEKQWRKLNPLKHDEAVRLGYGGKRYDRMQRQIEKKGFE